MINPNDGFFRSLQHFAETYCHIDYSQDNPSREGEVRRYNAYQLVAQLAYTKVTLEKAMRLLDRYDGDVCMAANYCVTAFENDNCGK